MSLLEIYIPAYDRPDELERLVSSLPPTDGVTVTIADDSGERRFEHVSVGMGTSYRPRRYNLGRDANVLVAVAECRAEWLWVMGDDDWLLSNALDTVLAEIARDRADRIITFSEAAHSRIALAGQALSDTEAIEALRHDPSVLIAATLCSANVFRTSTLDAAGGLRHMDTYYAYAYASLGAHRWAFLDQPTIGVGTDHCQSVPDVGRVWQDYLDSLCLAAGVAPISVRDAAQWNFVSVELQGANA